MDDEACKRNHGSEIMKEEASGSIKSYLGSIWKASRGFKEEAFGSIWGYLGSIWEASGSIWEHLGASGSIWRPSESGGPSLKCSQTAATDHSTAEWRRCEAQSTVKHMVLEPSRTARPPAHLSPMPKTSRQNPYRTSLFWELAP